MKFFNKKNSIVLKGIFLVTLLLSWFIFKTNDPLDKFVTIVLIVAVGSILAMDLYDYRKNKS